MNAVSMNPVAWFEIYVADIDRAKTFYESVLAISLSKLSDPTDSGAEMWAFPSEMDKYGATGSLVRMPGVTPGAGGTLIYFACDDCAVEAARVEGAGGQLQQAKMSIGEYGFIAVASDTEGNRFGLHSMT